MKYAIGLDIGGTKVAAGIVNEKGDLIQKEVVASDVTTRDKMFQSVVTCLKGLLNHSSIPLTEIEGIGAGVPGKVDTEHGIAVFQNNLPWSRFPFVKKIKERFDINHIVMDNDVYMAAFAEWKDANLKVNDLFVYMTISTGISVSIIQGGEFVRGTGFAGELGLVPVRAKSGVKRLEKVASGPAVEKYAKELLGDDSISAKDVFSNYTGENEKTKEIVDNTVASLTHGIYMINSLLDPKKIVFGGSVATQNPYLLTLIKNELNHYLIEQQKHILGGMSISNLGTNQGVIGAGLRVFND